MKATRLESRVEVLKLARLLGVAPERLSYLERVRAADLRRLRERATDRLFDADAAALQRVAAASRLLPAQLAASIGERAFGPMLCARVAGRLDPSRGVEMAARLPTEFLADVAVELDPRRVGEIIVRIPVERIVEVARELVARGEYVPMGRFVGHLGEEAVTAALEVIDDESLLRVVFVLEAKERLDHVAGLLPHDRMRGLVRAAAAGGLWPEALDLLNHLSVRRRCEFADVAAQENDDVLAGLIETVHAEGLWDLLLPVAKAMSEDTRRRFAALPAIHRREVLDGLVRAAAEQGTWRDLLPLVEHLPPRSQRQVAELASELATDDDDLGPLAELLPAR